MTVRPLFLLLVLSALFGALARCGWCADEGKPAADTTVEDPLRWVRVLVPVDRVRLEDCRNENIRYLPVDPEEFERLLSLVGSTSLTNGATKSAAVVSAVYKARLEGDALVDGDAALEVVHSAEGRVTMPLDPCGLAIDGPSWAGDGEPAALVGLGVDKGLEVLVERAGRLGFDWSLRGHRDAAGEITFQWEVPACPSNQLVLELPERVVPLPEHGIVVDQGPAGEGLRRWRIELGGHYQVKLRVVASDDTDDGLPSTRVRQSTEYDFSLHGVDVRTRVQFDVYGEPVRQLGVALDADLQMISASYVKARQGDTRLEWAAMSPPAGADQTRIVLDFPEPLEGVGRVVELRARAPLRMDRRWELPGIRPLGVFWEAGEAALSIPVPLQLEELVPHQGRQSSKIDPLPAPRSGERFAVRYFSPDATTQIVLARPEAPLHLDSGSLIQLSGGEVIGQIVAEVRVDRGERFELEADVARRWTVDSVETVPHEALANWSVEGEQGAATKLRIALAESLPNRQSDTPPVRLLIAARRPQARMRGSLGIDDLRPLQFSNAVPGKRFVCLRAPEPYELELTGAETLTRVDPQSLDARARELFREPPGEPLFEDDAGAAGLSVSLTMRKPGYSATIEVEATVAEESLAESYRFHCVPEAARMDRVVVQFSHARTARTRWTLGAEDEGNWTARRLPPGHADASTVEPEAGVSEPALEADGSTAEPDKERWEIRLHRPRSAPFEIRASRTTKLADGEAVSLASLPEAAVEQGTVVIRGTPGSTPVWIDAERLAAIPIPAAPAGRQNPTRAAFRYDPARDVDPQSGSVLRVARLGREAALRSAWVWSCRLESRFEASGAGWHLVTYRLENSGAARIRITLPPAAAGRDPRGVWVNDEPVTCRHTGDGAQRGLAIDLPPGEKFPVVSISFATAGRQLRVIDSVVPSWPEVDVPVLARHWT
ncbi:MAG: hypothetical protein HQ582_04985, partial [Planctomycetes bacterium]|nr:hypothetical protein [Planctomycetota bacterium]